MRLWEYLLAGDDKRDLSDPGTARAWLVRQPWLAAGFPRHVGDDGTLGLPMLPAWDDEVKSEWRQCVLALRSLAKRLKGRRPRQPCPQDGRSLRAADNLFAKYLGKLRVVPAQTPRTRGDRRPLWRKDFTGIAVFPTDDGARSGRPGSQRAGLVLRPVEWWYVPDILWQCVFCSLVNEQIESMCDFCGRPFDSLTKKGRRSRRSVCAKCSGKKWKQRTGRARLRELWRRQKKKQREQSGDSA